MLSQTEYLYIHDLLINFYNHDYFNYVCITNNPVNVSNSYYDVYCYVSKDDITYSNNSFKISSGYKLSFDSNNYSNNNVIDKLSKESISNYSLANNSKEYVYSNLEGYPDLLGDYRTSLNNHLSVNSFYLIPLILLVLIFIRFFKSIFRGD